jgi:hypothetical protein
VAEQRRRKTTESWKALLPSSEQRKKHKYFDEKK